MSPFETEFESRLEAFARDSRCCAAFTYTELTLRHLLASDSELAKQVDVHAGFWQRIRAGLRSAVFSAFDRIYDEVRNTNSAGQLLRFAARHKEMFAMPAVLARRNGAGLTGEPAGLCGAGRSEDGRVRLEPLFDELDERRTFYRRVVQPSRARLADGLLPDGEDATPDIIGRVGDAEIGRLAVFPLRLHRALDKLYREGRAPMPDCVPTSVSQLLSAGAPLHAESWEHERVAHSVAAFLRFQQLARPLEQLGAASPRDRDYLLEASRSPS